MPEPGTVRVQRGLGTARAAQQIPEQPADVRQIARRTRVFEQGERPYVVLLGALRVPAPLRDEPEQPVRAARVDRTPLRAQPPSSSPSSACASVSLPRRCSTPASSTPT